MNNTEWFYFGRDSFIMAAGIYLLAVNFAGFILMGADKRRARHGRWRISEKTFFIVSLLFGSLGTWAGMYAFRHKTKHLKFVIGIPVILVLQILLLSWIVCWGISAKGETELRMSALHWLSDCL